MDERSVVRDERSNRALSAASGRTSFPNRPKRIIEFGAAAVVMLARMIGEGGARVATPYR